MFARILEIAPRLEKKDELIKMMRQEVLPILKKQPGFLELLAFDPEIKNEKAVVIGLWAEKAHSDKFMREGFTKVEQMVKPYLMGPITFRTYNVETSLCEHFVEALTHAA
jgi:quinol monooxygenase YgiN